MNEIIISKGVETSLIYIADAVATTIIGEASLNGVAWFRSLFRHQQYNVNYWLENWNPTTDELMLILQDDNLSKIFSYKTLMISNEMYEEKLKIWPRISMSIVNNEVPEFDKVVQFVKLFESFDPSVLYFLGKVSSNGFLPHIEIVNERGQLEHHNPQKYSKYIAYTKCALEGLLYLDKNKIMLTDFGRELLNFIKTEYEEI